MSTENKARAEILSRIQMALQDVPAGEQSEPVTLARTYQHTTTADREEIIERFIERVTDYKVTVQRVEEAALKATINATCEKRGMQRLVIPADLPIAWLPESLELLRDNGNSLTNDQLDTSDGVLTGCALGIAQTGTIVLDSGVAQGRRVLTLLPDYHLCVVFERQIVGLVPEAIKQLASGIAQHQTTLTFISGPSATSDIELKRVEGVHGPRTLEVLVVY